MLAGFRAAGRGLVHLNRRGYVYVWANVMWAVLTIPVITAPAAWAGLVRVSYVAHRRPAAGLDDFFEGFRQNLIRSVPLAIANILIISATFSNLVTYSGQLGVGLIVLRGIWITSCVLWLVLQYFAWCFFYAMEKPAFIGALRNAWVMLIQNPLFVLGALILALLIAVVSTILPAAWFLITGGALAAIANSVVLDRLRAAGIERPPSFDEQLVVDPTPDDI